MEGGIGPTLVSYLRWTGVVGAGTVGMSATTTTGAAGSVIATAARAVARGGAAVGA